MNRISIFIAGAKDLKEQRDSLGRLANDLNAFYLESGQKASVVMSSYENFGANQDDYNRCITQQADLVIFVIDGKIGDITSEEIELAAKAFHKNGHPKILTFAHTAEPDSAEFRSFEERYNRLMVDYELDYYIDYSSINELTVKARIQIEKFVQRHIADMECKQKNDRRGALKKWLCISLITVAVFVAAFLTYHLFDNRKHIIFSKVETSAELEIDGITTEFVEEQLIKGIEECIENARTKYQDIQDEYNSTIPAGDCLIDSKHITYTRSANTFTGGIRKLTGRHNISVNLKLTTSDSLLISNIELFYEDSQHTKQLTERKSDFDDNGKCALALIRKSAAYIIGAYDPAVSILYDYNPTEGLSEYQMNNPWNDTLYTLNEREELLNDAANRDDGKAEFYVFLLANCFDHIWQEQMNPAMAEKACLYYKTIQARDSLYEDCFQHRITTMEAHAHLYGSIFGQRIETPEKLLQNGILGVDSGCRQLIIITDGYNAATLCTFEFEGEEWREKIHGQNVNIGVNGIALPGEKVEGDLKTPSGLYPISMAFGYKHDIDTKLDFVEVSSNHIWVCDTSSNDYNKLIVDTDGEHIRNPKNERLLRNDQLYKYAIVVDYNTNPVIKGDGSGIFMHIERSENHRTAGCISMPENTIVELLRWLDPDKNPHIYINGTPASTN